jgi:hypothetical protein
MGMVNLLGPVDSERYDYLRSAARLEIEIAARRDRGEDREPVDPEPEIEA